MGGAGMTATGLVLLLLGIIGLGVGLYYAYVCLRSRPRRRSPGRAGDVEQGPLISSDPDVNGNHEEGVEGGPPDGAALIPSKKTLDEPDANGTVPSGKPQPSAPNHKSAADPNGPKPLMALDDSSPPQLVPLQMPPDAGMTRALPLAAAAPLLVVPQPEMGRNVEASAPPAEAKEPPSPKAAPGGGSQPLEPGTPGSTPTPPSLLPASAPPKSISESDEEDGLLLQSRMHHDDSLDLELQPPPQTEPAPVEEPPAEKPDSAGSPPAEPQPEVLESHPAQPQPPEPEAVESQSAQSEPVEPQLKPVAEPEPVDLSQVQPEPEEPADLVDVEGVDQPSASTPIDHEPEELLTDSETPPEPKVEPEQVTPSAPEVESEPAPAELTPAPVSEPVSAELTPAPVSEPAPAELTPAPVSEPAPAELTPASVSEPAPETGVSSEPAPSLEEVPEDSTSQPESEEEPDSVEEDTSPLEDHAPSAPPHYGWRSMSEDATPEEGPAEVPPTAPVVVLVPVLDEVPVSREVPLTESAENPSSLPEAVEDLPAKKVEAPLDAAPPIMAEDEEVPADKPSTDEGTEPSVTDIPVALEDNKVPANEEPVIMEEKPFPVSVEPLSERRAPEDEKHGDDGLEALVAAPEEVERPKETLPGAPRDDTDTSTSEESDFESDEDPEVMATFTPRRADVPDRGPHPLGAMEPLECGEPLEGYPVTCQGEEPIYLEMYQPPEPSIPVRVMLPIEEEERPEDDDDDGRCEALAAPGQPPPAYTSREHSQASGDDSDATDSSEPEVTEYSFSSGPGADSTLGVLADEMVVADPPVTKYTSLDMDRGAPVDDAASDSASSLEDEEGVDEGIDVSPPMHRPSQNPPVVVVTPPPAQNASPAQVVVTSAEPRHPPATAPNTAQQEIKAGAAVSSAGAAAVEESESSISSDEDNLEETDAEVKEEIVPVTTVRAFPSAPPEGTPGATGVDDGLETVYYIPAETSSHQLGKRPFNSKEPNDQTGVVKDNQSGSSSTSSASLPNTETEDSAKVDSSDTDESSSLAKSKSSKIPRLMKP